MRGALSLSVLILVLTVNVPLAAAQNEIFSDNLETGDTSAWSLDFSFCTQVFGGRSLGGHCHRWLDNSGDWFESRRQCELWAPGGELVSVETPTEWIQIQSYLPSSSSDSWIGLSRGVSGGCPGAWQWESGAAPGFDAWDAGQPDEGACPACVASWNHLQYRWDDVACDASGLVSGAICEVDLSTVRIVGSNGGRMVFPNGAILDVPAGAVDEAAAIAIRPLECSELDPLLNARLMNSHDKNCLAAVEILPADLALAEPVTLTLPIGERQAGEVPVLVEVFPDESDYAYRPTDISHDPTSEILQLPLTKLGQYAVVALSEPSLSPPGQLEGKSTNIPCEQLRVSIRSDFVDLDVKDNEVECTLLFDAISVTFLDCEGSPTFLHEIAESVGCSDRTYFQGRICGPEVSGEACFQEPQPPATVVSGDTVQLHAWAKAIDPDQGHKELFIANIDVAAYQWQSHNTSLGRFPDPESGLLEAGECTGEICEVSVQVLNRYVSSPLPEGTVLVLASEEGIFDVEWNFTWISDQQCTVTGENSYSNVREQYSGDWVGTASYLIPDYLESQVLSYVPDGAIRYRRDVDGTASCRDPSRVVHWVYLEQQTWYPETPCTQYESRVELQEDEETMNFLACIPLQNYWYEYGSGMTCSGPLNISELRLDYGIPCVFPLSVELTHQGEGVFEVDETLHISPDCGMHVCSSYVPVTVHVRAVPRWDVTTSQSKEGSPQSP